MTNVANKENFVPLMKGVPMPIYVFTSKSKNNLRAFTNSVAGENLPQQFAPWRANGPIPADEQFPFRFERDKIEKAIHESGFQLWRIKPKAKAKAE